MNLPITSNYAFHIPKLHTTKCGLHVSISQLTHEKLLWRMHRRTAALDSPPVSEDHPISTVEQLNQHIREGHYEKSLVKQQASKRFADQLSLASALRPVAENSTVDAIVVGAGPAGLYLSAELAARGAAVCLLGMDAPFVNNYGVWVDEFEELGLSHTLEASWPDAMCYFKEGQQVKVGRAYGRVDRRKLHSHLRDLCATRGVSFMEGEAAAITPRPDGRFTDVTLTDGRTLTARMVSLTAGAAGGKFLQYESGAPLVASQTAYGIEADIEGYEDVYPADLMVFMDYRRHHTGLWSDTAKRLKPGAHPNAGDGLWGSDGEVPSFLYAMPLGGKRAFLEETCLVARPAVPFAALKRRLERRLDALGIKVVKVHEEEWSYIPVGGPLPLADGRVTAFGSAANLVHPATGFSISRSFREAPRMADEITKALRSPETPTSVSNQRIWSTLWPTEKRACSAFSLFGMELLALLDVEATTQFFSTFFQLPRLYWRGFLSSSLSSNQLIVFAFLMLVTAPWPIKYRLMEHLIRDPSGAYLIAAYLKVFNEPKEGETAASRADS